MRTNNNNNNNNKRNLSGGGGNRHRPRTNNNHKFRSGGGGGDSQSLDRQKKHAMAQKEKFQNLARDAQSNGERIEAEYYFQHVEHYTRTLAEIMEREPQPQSQHHASSEPRDDDRRESQQSSREDRAEQSDNRSDHDRDAEQSTSSADESGEPRQSEPQRAPRGRTKRRPAGASADSAQGEIPLPSSILPEPSPIESDSGNA